MQGVYIKDEDIDKIVNMLYANNMQRYGQGTQIPPPGYGVMPGMIQNSGGYNFLPGMPSSYGMPYGANMPNMPNMPNMAPQPGLVGGNFNIADIIKIAYACDSKMIQKKDLGGDDKGTYIMIPMNQTKYQGSAGYQKKQEKSSKGDKK
ncbi:MAG: hypothetical protein ACMXYG_04430 [Candidatus Woesearchaeota archaeon]